MNQKVDPLPGSLLTPISLHEGHQLLGNNKAQAGSAVHASRGTIGLAKSLKETPLGFERNADAAVLHFEPNLCMRLSFTRFGNPNDDLTFAR